MSSQTGWHSISSTVLLVGNLSLKRKFFRRSELACRLLLLKLWEKLLAAGRNAANISSISLTDAIASKIRDYRCRRSIGEVRITKPVSEADAKLKAELSSNFPPPPGALPNLI